VCLNFVILSHPPLLLAEALQGYIWGCPAEVTCLRDLGPAVVRDKGIIIEEVDLQGHRQAHAQTSSAALDSSTVSWSEFELGHECEPQDPMDWDTGAGEWRRTTCTGEVQDETVLGIEGGGAGTADQSLWCTGEVAQGDAGTGGFKGKVVPLLDLDTVGELESV